MARNPTSGQTALAGVQSHNRARRYKVAISSKIHGYMEAGSWIRRMFEAGIALKAKYGERNVFDLSLGNPVVEPPEEFQRELRRLVRESKPGLHRYMPNAGFA